MTLPDHLVQKGHDALLYAKTMNSAQLMILMDCSPRTLQRRLRQWDCHTSYNRNGQYYALPQVVQFDQFGIWQYIGVCFSRFGNMKQTVADIIHHAPQGLTAGELAEKLHVNVHSFLSQLADKLVFTREKFGTTFRYFSADPQRAGQQRQCYVASAQAVQPASLSNAVAVKLLLAWIDDPTVDPRKLSQSLRHQNVHVPPEAVALFLKKHNLLGKKKLHDTRTDGHQ